MTRFRVVLELVVQARGASDLVLARLLALALGPWALVSMGPRFGEDCSSSRDVASFTSGHHLEKLSVEKVLIDLSLCFHVADSDILQRFNGGKHFLGSHNFGFHFTRLQLN